MTPIEAKNYLEMLKCTVKEDSDQDRAIDVAISALEKRQWIPCSEKLPFAECGEGDKVLTTCTHRNAEDGEYKWVRFLYFNGGVWCYLTGETYDQKVIAWMPLPEPYKAEEEA